MNNGYIAEDASAQGRLVNKKNNKQTNTRLALHAETNGKRDTFTRQEG